MHYFLDIKNSLNDYNHIIIRWTIRFGFGCLRRRFVARLDKDEDGLSCVIVVVVSATALTRLMCAILAFFSLSNVRPGKQSGC